MSEFIEMIAWAGTLSQKRTYLFCPFSFEVWYPHVAVTMSEFIETGMQQSYGCHHLASEAARTASEAAVYGDSSQTYRRLYPTTL